MVVYFPFFNMKNGRQDHLVAGQRSCEFVTRVLGVGSMNEVISVRNVGALFDLPFLYFDRRFHCVGSLRSAHANTQIRLGAGARHFRCSDIQRSICPLFSNGCDLSPTSGCGVARGDSVHMLHHPRHFPSHLA